MKKQITLIILTVICAINFPKLNAQDRDHAPGEILIQLHPKTDLAAWRQKHAEKSKIATAEYGCIRNIVSVSAPLNIWKIQFDSTCTTENALLNALQRDPAVALAQFNHYVELRNTEPNDPLFPQQWQWYNRGQNADTPGLDIGLTQAWDITTGGVTSKGDSIVVAIIDTGTDTTHAELRPNLWYNRQEIPNNGKDDDGNGYIDDYQGWNSVRLNDDIYETDLSGHGTGIAGIIGAKGNNGLGGTGVNWNVKLMTAVWGASGTEEIILRAFSYVYTQRKLYNQSAGKKGAFVVSINASWGIPRLRSADYPIWCPFFDSLGQQGILTINAAGKDLVNTEKLGDIPSACPSDYLLVVTNIDEQGELKQAYGPNTVDLASFGQNVLSTRLRGGYREFSGTSFAAPQVAGAIALLYATSCGHLSELARSKPAEAALLSRHLILDGVEPIASLQDKVVTGGYLRVDNSLKLLSSYCVDDLKEPIELTVPNPFHDQLLLTIRANQDIELAMLEVFNLQGQKIAQRTVNITKGFKNSLSIDSNTWSQGMYLLRLKWGKKEYVVQKVVKM
jgi:serine protease